MSHHNENRSNGSNLDKRMPHGRYTRLKTTALLIAIASVLILSGVFAPDSWMQKEGSRFVAICAGVLFGLVGLIYMLSAKSRVFFTYSAPGHADPADILRAQWKRIVAEVESDKRIAVIGKEFHIVDAPSKNKIVALIPARGFDINKSTVSGCAIAMYDLSSIGPKQLMKPRWHGSNIFIEGTLQEAKKQVTEWSERKEEQ